MSRSPVLRSFFCCVFSSLIFYTAINVFYLEFSAPIPRVSVNPELLQYFLPSRYALPDDRWPGNLSEDNRRKVHGIVRNPEDAGSSRVSDEIWTLKGGGSQRGLGPLRVYMYDLPRKFTYGVVEEYFRARGLLKNPVSNDSELRYPGNQHSAEWWLYSDLIKPQSESVGVSAVRVKDPSEAEVFYVPFFSSLSLGVNPLKPEANPKTSYDDEQMQEELMEWLDKQESWHRHRGRDHVVICQDPNALRKVIDRLKNCILLLSDFGRLASDQSSLVKDVVIPYSHRIASYATENATLERKTLLFFMGNRYRKQGGKVRDQLFQVLENEEGMVIKHGTQSRENRRLAAQGMRTSKYCLHPAGDTPSACRLFDAIVSLCVPIVVSDEIELPFEDILDYSEFTIFVPSFKAVEKGYLASTLSQISSERLHQYQQQLRKVRKYFEYEKPNGAVDQIWRQVANKLPLMQIMIHRDRRSVEMVRQTGDCACICSNMSESSLR